jgi:hypothetical protein
MAEYAGIIPQAKTANITDSRAPGFGGTCIIFFLNRTINFDTAAGADCQVIQRHQGKWHSQARPKRVHLIFPTAVSRFSRTNSGLKSDTAT